MKNDQGEDVSTLEIKKILQNTIEEEDKKKPFQTINLPKS
jgi:RNA polymerase sigma-54 factor